MVKNCLACGALNDEDILNCLVCGAEFTLFQESNQLEAQKNKPKNTFQSKYSSSTKNQILYQFTPAPMLNTPPASTYPQVSAQPKSAQTTHHPKKATISPIYRATASRGPKDDPFLLPDDVRLSAAPIAFPAVSAQYKSFMPQTMIGAPNPQTLNGPFVESPKDLLAGEDFSFLDGNEDSKLDKSALSKQGNDDLAQKAEQSVREQNILTEDFDWNFNTNQFLKDQQSSQQHLENQSKTNIIDPSPLTPQNTEALLSDAFIKQATLPTEYLPQVKLQPEQAAAFHPSLSNHHQEVSLTEEELELLHPQFDAPALVQQEGASKGMEKDLSAPIPIHTAQHERISDMLEKVPADADQQSNVINHGIIENLVDPRLDLTPVPVHIEGFEEDIKNNHLLKLWSYLFLVISITFFAVYAYLSQELALSYQITGISKKNHIYQINIELNTPTDQIKIDVPESLSYQSNRISDQKIAYQIQVKEEQLKLGQQSLDLNWSYLNNSYPFSIPLSHYYELNQLTPIQTDGYYHLILTLAPSLKISQSNAQSIKALANDQYELLYSPQLAKQNEAQTLILNAEFNIVDEHSLSLNFQEKLILPISQLSLMLFYPSAKWKRQEDYMLVIGKAIPHAEITVSNATKNGSIFKKISANEFGIFELQMPIKGFEPQSFELQARAVGYETAKTNFIAQRMQQQDWFNHKGAMLAKGRQQLDSVYSIYQGQAWKKQAKIKLSAKVLWVAEHQKNNKNEIFQYYLVEYNESKLWLEIKNPELKGFEWLQRNHQITIYGSYLEDQSHLDPQGKAFSAPTIKIDHLYWF